MKHELQFLGFLLLCGLCVYLVVDQLYAVWIGR